MSDRLPMTRGGYERLRDELRRLKTTERRTVATEIEIARGHGDLRENADYEAAKNKQGMIEANIRDLEDKLARAEVIDVSSTKSERIVFGATVTLLDPQTDEQVTVQIVGETEADAKAGRVSISSPLARALIGKGVDDSVAVQAPGGRKAYDVVAIRFE